MTEKGRVKGGGGVSWRKGEKEEGGKKQKDEERKKKKSEPPFDRLSKSKSFSWRRIPHHWEKAWVDKVIRKKKEKKSKERERKRRMKGRKEPFFAFSPTPLWPLHFPPFSE